MEQSAENNLSAKRAAFIAEVLTWRGTPYGHQGRLKGPNGRVDCIGVPLCAARAIGLFAPDYDQTGYSEFANPSEMEARLDSAMERVPKGREKPGDIFYASDFDNGGAPRHMGVLIAPDVIMHAYSAISNGRGRREGRVVDQHLTPEMYLRIRRFYRIRGIDDD